MGPGFLILSTVGVLLFLSFLLSIAETAVTGSSEGKIYKYKLDGHSLADVLLSILEHRTRVVSMILVLNNTLNIISSTLATGLAIEAFGEQNGMKIAGVGMTFVIVVLCEIFPKKIGLKNPEKIALFLSPGLKIMLEVYLRLLSIFGVKTEPVKLNITPTSSNLESIRGELEMLHNKGSVIKHDKDMIDGLLDLEEVEVSSVMTPQKHVFAIDLTDDISKIINFITNNKHSRFPVYVEDDDNIIGILHKVDFLNLLLSKKYEITIKDIESILYKPAFVPENTKLKKQLLYFKSNNSHLSIVVDEYGSMVGIITLEDILEEVVGNIEDEHDVKQAKGIMHKPDGSVIVRGDFQIRDFNREMDTDFSHEDASSIGGLIISHAERIPEEREKFNIDGYIFEILKKNSSRISLIQIKKADVSEK